jgi:uncharacterized membrane protein YfcA
VPSADPWFYAVAIAAVLIVGVSKGGFGGSTGVMAAPLMALIMPPTTAAAILLPILCAMDLMAFWAFRRGWDGALLKVLIPSAIVGITVGGLTFRYLDDGAIRAMIGVLAVAFAAQYVWRELRAGRGPVERKPPRRGSGPFWAGMAGFTSFVAHAGGPPLTIHMLALKLDKRVYQATTVVFYAAVNYVKLVPYTALGLFHRDTLLVSLLMAPIAPLGIVLGVWLHHRIEERWYFRVVMAGLALTGVKLIADALAAA